MKRILTTLLGLMLINLPAGAKTSLDALLQTGNFKKGLVEYQYPADNSEKFSLAALQVLDAVQTFSSTISRLGFSPQMAGNGLPFLRIVPVGGSTTNEASRAAIGEAFDDLKSGLEDANRTLGRITDQEFKVEVNLNRIRIDLAGNGTNELLITTLSRIWSIPTQTTNKQDIIIHFDRGDAYWLKGYTHCLIGMIDVLQTYDWRPVWNQCAHVIFQHPNPMPSIALHEVPSDGRWTMWVDLIAAIHDMRLSPTNPNGLVDAREQFLQMIACSRLTWKSILAETDNDHEWLPNPQQTGPGGSKITQQQIDGWLHIMDETEHILKGEKLLPHWRIQAGTGINVDKLVRDPPPLDIILMIQGSTFIPYLEKGPISDASTWRMLTMPYGPDSPGSSSGPNNQHRPPIGNPA
jgi:hypothetical protein